MEMHKLLIQNPNQGISKFFYACVNVYREQKNYAKHKNVYTKIRDNAFPNIFKFA